MSEKSQNIENFFRKRLGQKEFPFREEDWSALEARLDAAPVGIGGTPWSGLKIAGAIAVIVTLSFLAGWFLKDFTINDSKEVHMEQALRQAEPVETDSISDELTSMEVPVTAKAPATRQPEVSSPGEAALANSGTKAANRGGHPLAETVSVQTLAPGAGAAALSAQPQSEGWSMASPSAEATVPGVVLNRMESRPVDQALGLRAVVPEINPVSTAAHPPVSDTEVFYRLSLALSASPDFSSVGLRPSLGEVGKAYGAGIEYRFSERWKISTGVLKADKVYTAREGDYNPPFYGGWPGGVEPVRTDAACSVLDIPLALSYGMLGGKKTSLWLNAGISSYWMLSESYHYVYDATPPSSPGGWYGKNENVHPFSVASLSVSVQTFVAPRWSLQLEPFLKAPLAGVGYGKVKLYTAGTLFTARYHFLKR